jgi:RHS repeat-associated protein
MLGVGVSSGGNRGADGGHAARRRIALAGVVAGAIAAVLMLCPALAGAAELSLRIDPLTAVEPDGGGGELQGALNGAQRDLSASAYRGLSSQAAVGLIRGTFPRLAGQAGIAASGVRATGYPTPFTASVLLAGNKHAVIDSLLPLTVGEKGGRRSPVDLGLVGRGSGYSPTTPAVPVQIPGRLGAGVVLEPAGISVRPSGADAAGFANDASVVYPNVAADTDVLVKPIVAGFELDEILRSADSPRRLTLSVSMPSGAKLVQHGRAIEVIERHRAAAVVLPPEATDAGGTRVPVSMSLAHGQIALDVRPASAPLYPIAVDPGIIDGALELNKNWEFQTTNAGMFRLASGGRAEIEDIEQNIKSPEHANFNYFTQGESHIYKVEVADAITEPDVPTSVDDVLAIRAKGGTSEASEQIGSGKRELCVGGALCPTGTVTSADRENRAFFEQQAFREPGNSSIGRALLESAAVGILQEKGPQVEFNRSATLNGKANMGDTTAWVNSNQGVLGVNAFDPGMGIGRIEWALDKPGTETPIEWKAPPSSGPPKSACAGAQCGECYEKECPTKVTGAPLMLETGALPEGEDTLSVSVSDSAGFPITKVVHAKIDNAPPTSLFIHGLPANGQIGESYYPLTVGALDGANVPSSGVKSLIVLANGLQIGKVGGCEPGPCTAAGKVVLPQLGAGKNVVTLVATDGAGNVATKEVTVYVSHASAIGAGEVPINPITGAGYLSSTDVNIGVPGGGALTVTRSYDSRQLSAGSEGPIGEQWQLGVTRASSLLVGGNGATLYGASGSIAHFVKLESGAWEAPKTDQNLTLSEVKEGAKVKEYLEKNIDTGAIERFTQPSGSEAGAPWRPTISEERVPTDTFAFTYATEKVSESRTIVKPAEELAPVPAGVSCAPTLQPGCRALEFKYATSKTATGENRESWGSYTGRLAEVVYVAFDPKAGEHGEMVHRPVAAYEYDNHGRLRAEWNPSISPALKTTYGYDDWVDGEQVTAVTPPGHQPMLLRYGLTASDPSSERTEGHNLAALPGRVLSITTPTTEPLTESGKVPQSTTAPSLSSTVATVGTTLTAGTGSWSNTPLAYTYQWERCLAGGNHCSLIPGATNRTYTPVAADAGDGVFAEVLAENGTGAQFAASATSKPVAISMPGSPTLIGKAGKGSGEFTWVGGVARDSEGHIWATDPGNNRVQELSAEGKWIASFGVEGQSKTSVQFREPTAIAINSAGNIYITDRLNDRIEELGPKGEFIRVFGTTETSAGPLNDPDGITFDANGDAWVSDTGNNRLVEFTGEGSFIRTYGSAGTGSGQFSEPEGIGFWENREGEGVLFVADRGNNRVAAVSVTSGWEWSFGEEGKKKGAFFKQPSGIAIGPETGTVYVVDSGNDRIEAFNDFGQYEGVFGKKGAKKAGQLLNPTGLVATSSGVVYVADSSNSRIQKFLPTFSTNDPLPAAPESEKKAIWTVEYGVPVAGTGAPNALGEASTSAWAQKDNPETGTAVYPPDEPEGWPASDYKRATIDYMDQSGNLVNVASPTGGVGTMEYNEKADLVRSLSPDAREQALGAGANSAKVAEKLDTRSTYNSEGNELLSSEGPEHEIKLAAGGSPIEARAETTYGYDEGAPSEGGPFNRLTSTKSFAAWSGGPSDTRETVDGYNKEGNNVEGWRVGRQTSVTAQPHGMALGHQFKYDEAGNALETRQPGGSGAHSGTTSPTTTLITYYTNAPNEETGACGKHAEWAGLPCKTKPAVQPHTAHTAELPETETTYNVYDEPEVVVEKFGAGNERTVVNKYDTAGRLTSSQVTGATGEPLPTVTFAYNKLNGMLETESAAGQSITSEYNARGQLVSYTDEGGEPATYRYDVDGRLVEANDGKAGGKGDTTYSYNTTTGMPEEMVSSACPQCKFKATWDKEGRQTSETLPDGLTAYDGYNPAGTLTSLVYKKTTNCTEEHERCIWFKDSVTPSIHGQWLAQESSLSSETYSYDEVGRLTQVQDTPTGGSCTTRKYSYDEEGNRLSLTTVPANGKGECVSSGGTTEAHSYDSGNRLLDSGTAYNVFGDSTAIPAADAGAQELTSKFFVDNQVASQTQNGLTLGYTLDPSRRIREDATSGTKTGTETNHYAGPGDLVAWTSNLAGEQTQNIVGLDGRLIAVQENSEAPVLQIVNLHGDIVGTASLSETAEKLASTADSTEFGVPSVSQPSKYSWLGGIEVPTELPSGVQEMGVRSYVPQLGRFLQPDPVPGGSANAYTYTFDDPVDSYDPSGEYAIGEHRESWTLESTTAEIEAHAHVVAVKEAEEAAARAEAERLQRESEEAQALAGEYEEEGEEGEEVEEEGEGEYVADHRGAETDGLESGILTESPGENEGPENGGEANGTSAGPPRSAFGTHTRMGIKLHYHYVGPSTAYKIMCALTPLVELMASQSNVGNAVVHESKPRCK